MTDDIFIKGCPLTPRSRANKGRGSFRFWYGVARREGLRGYVLGLFDRRQFVMALGNRYNIGAGHD